MRDQWPSDFIVSLYLLQASDCPKFQDNTDKHYIPAGISKTLTFSVANLVNSSVSTIAIQ